MTEQTIRITNPINREDLEAVVTGLEVACGGIRIGISEAFDLVVKDERQAAAIKALFSLNGKDKEAIFVPKGGKQKKAPGPAKAVGMRSYRFDASDERISGQALNKRLAAHAIPEGTILKNAKGEQFLVAQSFNDLGGSYVLEKQS